jgi:NifU-like protein involved in Fe-S cluster formation
LRTLIALGEMANEVEINKEIDTAQEFDESIRKLSKLVRDFAHNPVHQSNKVFNTDQAERAQTDLLTIINLSKALEDKSKNYSYDHRQHGQ